MTAGEATGETGPADPALLRAPTTLASYRTLLRNRNYRFWFFAALTTSLGDWAGLFALQILVTDVAGTPQLELFSLGGIMMARLLPSLILGPVAGVLADRYQRRRLMVIVDVVRGALFIIMAFSGDLVAIFALTLIIETMALLFLSAKDAMLPTLVEPDELTQANQLNFLVTYGTLPFGAALAFTMASLVTLLGRWNIDLEPTPTVLVLNAATFFVSAVLVRGIRPPEAEHRPRPAPDDAEPPSPISDLLREIREGLRAIADQPLVYALVAGVTGVFFGAGIIVALGPVFVKNTLGRPETDWFTLLTVLGVGLIIGIGSVPLLTNRFRSERIYPVFLVVTSVVATAIALTFSWVLTLVFGFLLGLGVGPAVVTGFTMLQSYTADDIRGRTFSVFYTGSRVATFAALGLAPFLAGSIDVITIGVAGTGDANAQFALGGVRVTMLAGGLVALWFAQRSGRAMWRASREPDDEGPTRPPTPAAGMLIAFEGVEGAGKSTHVARLAEHLRSQGIEVVTTREPGGTRVAEAVRDLLLDGDLEPMDDHTEALLYAAARAEHVAKVIRPALERGAVVITDRYLDSSLAYQGYARGLGIDEVTRVNGWATSDTFADLVVLLHLDVEEGLRRAAARRDGDADRLEGESVEFHREVAAGFSVLAQRHPDRFVVIDADAPVDDVAEQIREAVTERLGLS